MEILLFTHNYVVREFVELAAEEVGATLDVVDDSLNFAKERYDYVFVDDKISFLEEIIQNLDDIASKSVILYNTQDDIWDHFDTQIKKPFLPSDIKNILTTNDKETTADQEAQVLDLQEISEIKKLLEEDGVQIVSEEDLVEEIDGESEDQNTAEAEKENTLKPIENDIGDQNKADIETNTELEEKLLGAILKMKPKKIRKLLKGAEVTLKIKFPKDSNE